MNCRRYSLRVGRSNMPACPKYGSFYFDGTAQGRDARNTAPYLAPNTSIDSMGIRGIPVSHKNLAQLPMEIAGFMGSRGVLRPDNKANTTSIDEVISRPVGGANVGCLFSDEVLVVIDPCVGNLCLIW